MKKKKEKVEPLRLYIDYSERRTGGEAIGEGPWCSHEDEDTEVSFLGMYRTSPTHKFFYDSIEVSEEVHKADEVYLCVVRYSTGSTFGRRNGAWTIIGVATDSRKAQEMLDKALNGDGYKPWEGYFERLEGTEIHDFRVRQ